MRDYIEQRGSGYYLKGTRVSLDSIVHAFKSGESPESILDSFPMAGPLVRIYGAITFYLENSEAVEAYLSEENDLPARIDALQSSDQPTFVARVVAAREYTVSPH